MNSADFTSSPVPPQSLSTMVDNLSNDVGGLYGYAKNSVCKKLEGSSLKPTADRIVEYVLEHADIVFWGMTVINIFTAPICFILGMLAGIALQAGYRLGLCDHQVKVISSESHKVEYAFLSVVTKLFIKTLLHGTITGFVVGTYLGDYGLKHDFLPRFMEIKQRVLGLSSALREIVEETPLY